jgi:hypothetical protein
LSSVRFNPPLIDGSAYLFRAKVQSPSSSSDFISASNAIVINPSLTASMMEFHDIDAAETPLNVTFELSNVYSSKQLSASIRYPIDKMLDDIIPISSIFFDDSKDTVLVVVTLPQLTGGGIASITFKEISGESIRQVVSSFSVISPAVPLSVKNSVIEVSPDGEPFSVILTAVPDVEELCRAPWKLHASDRVLIPVSCSGTALELVLSFPPVKYYRFVPDPTALPDSRYFFTNYTQAGKVMQVKFLLVFEDPLASHIDTYPAPVRLERDGATFVNFSIYACLPLFI